MVKKNTRERLTPGGRYMALVRSFPLRPIRSDTELSAAIAVIDALLDRDDLEPEESDYLDVLGDLIRKYEKKGNPPPQLSAADMLRHLIESRETSQAAVAEATGIAESTVSAILAGKRGLTRGHIEALARHFKVTPAVFLPV